MSAEDVADGIGIAGSLLHPPTKEQLKRFIDELNNLPPASTPQDKLFFERLCVLECMQAASHEEWRWSAMDGLPDSLTTQCLAVLRVDWNISTKRFNEIVDETCRLDGTGTRGHAVGRR